MVLISRSKNVRTLMFVSALVVFLNLSSSAAFSRNNRSFQRHPLPLRKPLCVAQPILEVERQYDPCPPGYNECCSPSLGGRISQPQLVETLVGPVKQASTAIASLCGIDKKKIGSLGVSFALSYSVISNINGAASLSVAWYMTCTRTGLSPLWQWKELLKSYATIYAVIQVLRPFRVAAAIAMSKLSKEFLDQTQAKLDCSRRYAVALHVVLSQVMYAVCAGLGVISASCLSGVPIFTH